MRYPSWSDYATHDSSDEPGLWNGIWAAYAPHLGATGSTLYDMSGRNAHASGNNWTPDSGWTTRKGVQDVAFLESASTTRLILPSRASLQGQLQGSFSLWLYSIATPAATTSIVYDGITASTNNRFGVNWTSTGVIQFQVRDATTTYTIAPSGATHTGVYGRWAHWAGYYDSISDNMQFFRDGVVVGTNVIAKAAIVAGTPTEVSIGGRNFASTSVETSSDHEIADFRLWNRVLSSAEILALAQFPGVGYNRRSRIFRASVAVELISGTIAATTASSTPSASGSQTHSGSSAATLANATSSANGSQTHSGSVAVTLAGATSSATGSSLDPAIGTIASTTASATGSATAATTAIGTIASTTASATGSATAATTATGTIASTTASATGSATATTTVTGTIASTTASATGSATGQNGNEVAGLVAVLVDSVTHSITGAVTQAGTVATTTSCTAAATGVVTIVGVGTATTVATSSGSGGMTVRGLVDAFPGPATASAVGSALVTGQASATLASAYATTSGLVPVTDLTLTGSIGVAAVAGKLDTPSVAGRVGVETIRGQKLWR